VIKLDAEHDIERLRQAALLLEQENRKLIEKNLELNRENLALKGVDPAKLQTRLELLEQQLAVRNQMVFGKSSEKRPAANGEKACAAEPAKKPQRGHGPREQPNLPIVDVKHELDEADRKSCPQCGGGLTAWDGQFEESEEIDVVERRFVLKKHKRQKYRCTCNACIETAPAPTKLFDGARYSIDFAIDVASGKYLDHLPLERQVRMMARDGLVVDSQTLWDQINVLAKRLEPAHDRLHDYILTLPVIGADETRWPLMGRKPDEGKLWQVWAIVAPDAICHRILPGRGNDACRELLRAYRGIVMADGYSTYKSLASEPASFTLANCWSHARRELIDIEPFFPVEAKQGIDLIRELYLVENLCPNGPPGDELRRQLRRERSTAILEQIQTWMNTTRALPESGLGRAIKYISGRWAGLTRFVDDPRIPIDNNAAERGLRGVVVGRKNHYGSRSRRGTEVAALFYSLLESAKLVGIEPKAYLRRATLAALNGDTIPLPHEVAPASRS
jgi:transposase